MLKLRDFTHFHNELSEPLPPNEEGVRVLNSGTSLICEVEWKSPPITNGRITKYYVSSRLVYSSYLVIILSLQVRVVGSIRRPRPDGQIVADHYPSASEQGGKCANWDSEERLTDGINPVDFSTEFLSCKYGPLKVILTKSQLCKDTLKPMISLLFVHKRRVF